jgi:glutamate:GABA antiporter
MSRPAFARVLGRADLLLFTVSAVLTIDTLSAAASTGVAWFTWWGLTMALFFFPYALITAELGAAWPAQGGLHVWVREGLGSRWAGLASWLYWINNAYWMPSAYLVFAATFEAIFLSSRRPARQTAIALVLTWATVGLGVLRLSLAKWIPSLAGLVKLSLFVILGLLGLVALALGRPPANDFAPHAFAPRWSDSLAFLPVLLYNALGFELPSAAGEEMRDPQRDVPRAVTRGAVLIGGVYVLGVLGILLAVPLRELSLVTGTWDALAILGRQGGRAGGVLVLLLGVAFLYALVGSVVTWTLGANRVAAAAAAEGALPAALGRLHPRFHTPYVAFVVMGLLSTGLLLGNAALAGNPQNVFWMTFKLAGICFLLSYLLVFPAFVRLRLSQPERPRPYRVPGGWPGALAGASLCWTLVLLASLLFFKPAPDSVAPLRDGLLLGAETLATVVTGLIFARQTASRP